MSKQTKAHSFIKRNLVTIVMVPSLIALHMGWSGMQKNPALLGEHEEVESPIVVFYKYCLRKLSVEKPPAEVSAVKAKNT